jgi:5-methylcytosine-specific restriction endonuclease McrA
MNKGAAKKSRAAINRDYRNSHRDKCNAWKHNRRAREAELGGIYTDEEWQRVKDNFNNLCAECHRNVKLTVDHIVPLTKWKEWAEVNKPNYKWNDIENIQPLCLSCNSSKNDSLKI